VTLDNICLSLGVSEGVNVNSDWRWPEIKGLHSFKGSLMHSANWDPNTKLDGQRIGVIGNGSSGIQILTALQPGMFPLSPDIFYAVLE
jgi:hypothetical protein